MRTGKGSCLEEDAMIKNSIWKDALLGWKGAPTHSITGMMELTPTILYATCKTRATQGHVTCRICDKAPESLALVLCGCSALAKNRYLQGTMLPPDFAFREAQGLGTGRFSTAVVFTCGAEALIQVVRGKGVVGRASVHRT